MAERQSNHRMAQEDKVASANIEAMRREFYEARFGQICAVVIVLSFIAGGVFTAVNGHAWEGTSLAAVGAAIHAIATAFIKGREGKDDESDTGADREKRP